MNIGILNRSTVNDTAAENEGSSFVETNYWSSTEGDTNRAWIQDFFGIGSQYFNEKATRTMCVLFELFNNLVTCLPAGKFNYLK